MHGKDWLIGITKLVYASLGRLGSVELFLSNLTKRCQGTKDCIPVEAWIYKFFVFCSEVKFKLSKVEVLLAHKLKSILIPWMPKQLLSWNEALALVVVAQKLAIPNLVKNMRHFLKSDGNGILLKLFTYLWSTFLTLFPSLTRVFQTRHFNHNSFFMF